VATFLILFRLRGKTRLGDTELARQMMRDVAAAVNALGEEALIVDAPGGQNDAVAAALMPLRGPVTILNGDIPCVTSTEIEDLTSSAPALVAARDGTTNAVALGDAGDFQPFYGPGSAQRFADHLRAARLALPGMRDDVDTWEDLERVRDRVGRFTRGYLNELARA